MSAPALLAAAADGHIQRGEAVSFWILGPVAVAGAIGTVLLRNAVHSALSLVATMMCLGLFYVIEQGPFLGLVQIIVYTGAIMILFLFVLMLVGRDSSDSLVETLRGQRVAAALAASASPLIVAGAVGRAFAGTMPANLDQPNANGAQRRRHRRAAVHQVPVRVRAHLRAADRRRDRRDGAGPHRARRAQAHPEGAGPRAHPLADARSRCPVPACSPRGNAIGTPALLPDGSIAAESVHVRRPRRRAVRRRRARERCTRR